MVKWAWLKCKTTIRSELRASASLVATKRNEPRWARAKNGTRVGECWS